MKFRRCAILSCSLLFSLFISFSLIILSVITEENEFVDKWKPTQIARNLDTRSLLLRQWSEREEETISRKLIKLYGINKYQHFNNSSWMIANNWVTPMEIHPESTPELGFVLDSMHRKRIVWAGFGHKGTQLKLTIALDGGQYAIFKPRWYARDTVIKGEPYEGHDRHNGEIVAFHLNRILGFRRAPLATGRVVDLQEEIIPVATKKLRQTFFAKDEKDICFLGRCLYCKTKDDAACGNGTKMEGAVILWLPKSYTFDQFRHPWSRSYDTHRKARWELTNKGEDYCSVVQQMPLFRTGSLLLDIIDTCIFDFLIGNADRHHFEVFANVTNPVLLLIDNAKSFGNPHHDEMSILAPLTQCKFIRKSTAEKLNQLKSGIIMRVLKATLTSDPLSPLLTGPHLLAIGRRLDTVIGILSHGVYTFL